MSFVRSVSSDHYPRDLSSAYQGPRIYDPAWALSKDPEADDKLLRDTVVASLVRQRKHKVAPLKWRMEPGDDTPIAKKFAKTVEQMLKRIDGFSEARFNLADAELKGRAYAFIKGQYQPDTFGDGFARLWWVPRQLVDMDRRRFRRVVTCRNPMRTAWELWDVEHRKWCRITAPEVFVKHSYDDDESNLGYGRGLMDSLYIYWRAKTIVLEEGLAGVERWARGAVVAKIDGLRDASTGKTNETVAQAYLDILDRTKARHAMAFDKTDDVAPMQGGGEGHQIVMSFLQYLDGAMAELLLGKQRLDSDSGSLARSETEADEGDQSMAFSRERLDETLQRDLVGLCLEVNRDVFNTMGFASVQPPRFTSAPVSRPKPNDAATTAKTLLDAGVRLVAKDVYEQTGFAQPLPGDDVIEPRPAPSPMPSPFGPGGFGPPPGDKQPTDEGGSKPPPPASRPDDEKARMAARIESLEADLRTKRVVDALDRFAAVEGNRPTPPAPQVHVAAPNVVAQFAMPEAPPPPTVNVTVEPPVVHVAAPNVTVEAAAPVVVPAPVVSVAPAAVTVTPAVSVPDVHVTVEAPRPVPKTVRIERDSMGRPTGATIEPEEPKE